MNDNVTKFYPKNAAKNPDNVLEQAIGKYTDVLVIGWSKEDGILDARSSDGLAPKAALIWLIESFKHKVMRGDYDADDEDG